MATESPAKFTVYDGPKVKYPDLENSVYDWIIKHRFSEMPFLTIDSIDKEISLNPNFKNRDEKKRFSWVHDFSKRRNLSVRTSNRVS